MIRALIWSKSLFAVLAGRGTGSGSEGEAARKKTASLHRAPLILQRALSLDFKTSRAIHMYCIDTENYTGTLPQPLNWCGRWSSPRVAG